MRFLSIGRILQEAVRSKCSRARRPPPGSGRSPAKKDPDSLVNDRYI